MLNNAAIAMLCIFGAMALFFPIAGLYEYVLCPVWDRIKERSYE